MKKIFYFFILLFILVTCSCASSKEEGYINLKTLYNENIEEALDYYEELYSGISEYGIVKKKKNHSVLLDNGSVIDDYKRYVYIVYNDVQMIVAYEFETKEMCQFIYDSIFNDELTDLYSIRENIIYLENTGSYILLSGNMIQKDELYMDSYCENIVIDCDENLQDIFFIPDNIIKVTAIVFSFTNVKKYILNKEMKYIGGLAFSYNEKLEEVTLNDGLCIIGKHCFVQCPNLKYVVIPSTVTYIGTIAFECETLYCNVESKPSGWDNDFASKNTKVYWKGEWKYDENGIPTSIQIDNEPTTN